MTNQVLIKKKSLKKGRAAVKAYDPQKEALFKKFRESLESAGYQVRREELKRGAGWKVMSGSCRAMDQKFIFVDRRLSQDEQLEFLRDQMSGRGIVLAL